MKTKIIAPTAEQIADRKRLRLICEWFNDLNTQLAAGECLATDVRAEIDAQNFDRSDLMAIRNRPGLWAVGDPYRWLWILHRYQNSATGKIA